MLIQNNTKPKAICKAPETNISALVSFTLIEINSPIYH